MIARRSPPVSEVAPEVVVPEVRGGGDPAGGPAVAEGHCGKKRAGRDTALNTGIGRRAFLQKELSGRKSFPAEEAFRQKKLFGRADLATGRRWIPGGGRAGSTGRADAGRLGQRAAE